jgi:SAM-dependent methyltransferase
VTLPHRYTDLAPWFHLLTAPADYAEEAEDVRRLVVERLPTARTLLELGSGGGNTASHLKASFTLTLVDLSPDMLAVSRSLNPGCTHLVGDMRAVRLGERFDAVLIHDAIMYMATEADLAAAIRTAAAHCRPGGVVVLMPDHTAETFEAETYHGGHDGADGRGLRYVEWVLDTDPADDTYTVLMAYIARAPDGTVTHAVDETRYGLFPRATWLRLLADAGVTAEIYRDRWERDVFVGVARDATG